MLKDTFGNPIFQEQDIFSMFYRGHLEHLDQIFAESTPDVIKLLNQLGVKNKTVDSALSQEEFDKINQSSWFMPDEYKQMDIESYLVHVCPKENYQRLIDELQAYRERNMLDLLRWLKYFVDTSRKNGIVWGVGRGSSVASYVLYLIGVHKIDSIKYNLDWQEFLR